MHIYEFIEVSPNVNTLEIHMRVVYVPKNDSRIMNIVREWPETYEAEIKFHQNADLQGSFTTVVASKERT